MSIYEVYKCRNWFGSSGYRSIILTAFRENRLKKEGNEIVAKIESFKKDNQRLPEDLSEIGVEEKEEGPLHYKKESDSKYIIWFGMELGESVIYESDTEQWKP